MPLPVSKPDLGDAASGRSAGAMTMQRFSVPFEYPVYFGRGLLSDPGNPLLRQAICRREPERRHRFVVLIDQDVAAAHPRLPAAFERYARRHRDALELAAPPRLTMGGEACKNDPEQLFALQGWLQQCHVDRHSCVVIVGGGALLDMAGFAAATTHRGVRVVRMPTTVLAQNDSGVGVKTAINAFGAKNFLGAFAPPFAVLNDYDFIASLPRRDRIAGIAEAVKVAAIRDRAFFDWLDANAEALTDGDDEAMQWMIRRCAELHLNHIGQGGDPFEFGSARPLDFGHWAAHKLEALSGYALRHGEAVAIGLALDCRYAVLAGLLREPAQLSLHRLLLRLGFSLWHPALDWRDGERRQVLAGLDEFREHLGGELTITLLQRLGQGVEVHAIDADRMNAAIDWLRDRSDDHVAA
ncbi:MULTISPECIES: 3-dehydroquinate synthase [Chromobacterium]|uniref:3-dehydroquinate synthase n=2 Tax=Chromobacterium TaxID=535 RepID=A0ABS3GQP7_9NEIS|nr:MULTISPECIES: 3-dehydroquinate synthase [Chromobacterium]MBK0416170.1 3-dehydroquinate synthase [Chromobacterium haemolyticum]MBO0417366.1 3-dehydroquinate synthase [Chromobacterium haemolyticum]MBO0500499.1 3-dehydroquinate synthase [Chromobacterium haemolyticum]MDH0343710.1 3-dehydroquinate synthase [Chromobacterium haemolyticum]BBH15557.1 3-dehydroquinate synthase [Chromobacterium haemolyticum]